ncbi:MAG: hypothetical protein IPQ19_14270 [Bacteroidetes bacterium]|nr:hypothetical protein [Bacteroidota bacterium]
MGIFNIYSGIFLVFQALFNLAAFPMDWIEGILWISNLLGDVIPMDYSINL